MSQISIPNVALHILDPQPDTVAPLVLADSPRIPPELYVDSEHHGSIYCPDCGVKCSRRPRKEAKRKDDVDAFYFHMPGFDQIECPHRKRAGGGGGGDAGKEKRAINLVTFAGWKGLGDDEDQDDIDDIEGKVKKKQKVQGGASVSGRGFELYFDEAGALVNPGEFRTVRRLVQLAQISLNVFVQFDGQDAIRLGDLIVPVEKVQEDFDRYSGKSFLFFGQPTSIVRGVHRVFFNFQAPNHQLSGHCDPAIFDKREWKTFERDRYYIFYGVVEGGETHSIVRIEEAGQIDRLPMTARELFASFR
jgi:hypothetical protein